jgi:hypothetical protein
VTLPDLPFLDGRKGPDESTNAVGQIVHDHLPRNFNWVDDDTVRDSFDIHARSTRILRRIEHKLPGDDLKRSQREVYLLYAEAIGALAGRGRVDAVESGVFVLELDTDRRPLVARATRVFYNGTHGATLVLDGDLLVAFLSARPCWRDAQ